MTKYSRFIFFGLSAFLFNTIYVGVLNSQEDDQIYKHYVSLDAVKEMCQALYSQAALSENRFEPELIIGLSRGGLIPLGFLAGEGMFNNRNVKIISVASYCDEGKQHSLKLLAPWGEEDFEYLKRFRSILIVDDLVDSGKSLSFVLNLLHTHLPHASLKTAVLFYKSCSVIKPDYYVEERNDWVVFPWEYIHAN